MQTTILNGATVAKFSPGTCSTCGCGPSVPYRRIVDGRIIEGCVDLTHNGQLHGSSLAWHDRKSAKALRKSAKRSMGPIKAAGLR